MSLRRCGHGEPLGLSCAACEAMRRSIEAVEAEDARDRIAPIQARAAYEAQQEAEEIRPRRTMAKVRPGAAKWRERA